MVWEVGSPELGAARTARGQAWVPSNNRDFLRRPPVEPVRDDIEVVDVYVVPTDADAEPEPTPDLAGATDGSFEAGSGTWRAIYVDSPETLVPKLRMANERGLAGAGFWAIGFERGLPGYRELFDAFRRDELPAP
jgi:hypothetical protein